MNAVRAARWSFTLAGIYGLAATLPLYGGVSLSTDGLWKIGFAGAAAATQLLYLLIGRDPVRYRATIPVGIVSKLSFGIPATLLATAEASSGLLAFGVIDLALAALFAALFVALGRAA